MTRVKSALSATGFVSLLGATVLSSTVIAQITVKAEFQRTQFLRDESVEVWVTVTSQSRKVVSLHNTDSKPWLSFAVNDNQKQPVSARPNLPPVPDLSIPPNQTLGRVVNLQSRFDLGKPGRFQITAAVDHDGKRFTSATQVISIGAGDLLWEKLASVPGAASSATLEPRSYQLIRFSTTEGAKLYVRVSNPDTKTVFHCYPLAAILPKAVPETRFKSSGELCVIHEVAENYFAFSILASDGTPRVREHYTARSSRPALVPNSHGNVVVQGGEKYTGTLETGDKKKR